MKVGDLVVWALPSNDVAHGVQNGKIAGIITCIPSARAREEKPAVQVFCDGKLVWVPQELLEVTK